MALQIFITFLLVFMNGFFVAAEFAIVKVRASQLAMKVKSGNRFAILAKHITTHLDGYLAATQLGITLASLGLGWIGEPVVSQIIIKSLHLVGVTIRPELAHDIALPVAFALITILHIVFGELAPKSIAIQRPERTTLVIAYPLQLFYIVFRPFIWILNGIANVMLKAIGVSNVHGTEVHSSEELKYLVQQGKETGTIEPANYDLIRNAFDFSERRVRQAMVPRIHVTAIDINNVNEAILEKVIEENFSRIPCYENDMDHIIGVVYLKDLLMQMRKGKQTGISEIIRPIKVIPETMRISRVLKEFQVKHQQIAVVVNEYGGTEGIITMEDILEELVGEIQDEYDAETPVVERMGKKIFSVRASAPIDDVNRSLPHPIKKEKHHETLAGLLSLKFGKIPNTNDKMVFDNYEFTILKKIRNSIVLVQLRDLSPDKVETNESAELE
jgi:CBS domain containing-hemolysin-like protein